MVGQRYRPTLAGRVTILSTMAVGLAVAIVAGAGYLFVHHTLYSSLDTSLRTRIHTMYDIGVSEDNIRGLQPWVLGAGDVRIGIMYADDRQPLSPSSAQASETIALGRPEQLVAQGKSKYSCRTIQADNGHEYRVAAVPGRDTDTALVLAQSLDPTDDTLDKLGLVLAFFGVLGVAAAAVAGWGVARNGLRPVRRLTARIEDIARTERLDPITVEGNDEIARLSQAFNAMLVALAASRDRQRQLVADAGHELRTPLTSLRTNLDLLTQADKQGGLSETAREELLGDVRFQIEELTTLIGDLTELAREQQMPMTVDAVDFDEIVERAVDRVRRRAPALQFVVDLDQWWVIGEAGALERAVTNVLDNAAKWSPPGGAVTVVLREGTLAVTDQGPGIQPTDIPHVFDRFYRSTESRTMPGSGLGLAIVRQTVERHGGEVWVSESSPAGTSITMTLPGSSTRPASSESIHRESTAHS
jgi:two-component system, OmpR family, sensor histidine kinase MprB